MKIILKHFFLLFVFMFAGIQAFAQDGGTYVEYEGVKYLCFGDNTAKVAGFAAGAGASVLKVPESFENDGVEYTVSAVNNSAFMSSESLAEVELPSTVKVIEYSAFDGCMGLRTVKLAEGLETIEYDAFGMCMALESINIPSTVRTLGDMVFFGCGELTSIEIPEGVTEIGKVSFQSCYMLDTVILPESLEKIGDYAFSDCGVLTSVKIPDGVKHIGDFAFYFSNIQELNIPADIEYVGDGAFDYTPWYDEWLAAQPEGLNYLGRVAYVYKGDAPAGTEVVIKDGTVKVAMNAFSYCAGIVSVDIPNSVTAFGPKAFKGCGDLVSVKMPENIKLIDTQTFMECQSLEDITIPQSVERLGMSAFYGCSSLKSIVLPENVGEIGAGVFEECPSIEKVYSLNKVAPVMAKSGEGESVFFDNDVYENATLYIPEGSLVSYTGTGDWGKFINVVQGDNLAVENVENTKAAVIVKDGAIVLPAGMHADVYDMTGRLVYSGNDGVIGVRQGMYVVKVNGSVTKVVVK